MGYLWSLSSNFYISDLENRIFNSIKTPPIYLRYVDDDLILANNINEINIQQDTFQKNSVFNFTHELNKNNNISFLHVLIDTYNNYNFTTPTYKKKPPVITSVLSTLKMNAPSDIKKQLLITWYPVPNWLPPPKQYFIKR